MVGQGYYAADVDEPAEFVLKRIPGKDGSYLMQKQFRYVHHNGEEWTIPAEAGQEFETDLASIPSLAGWLVPKDGRHTPAALVHDAMILGPGETHCYQGREVTAEEADHIFREGMQFLGVKFLRRWMIWAAVSLLTQWRSAQDTPLVRALNRAKLVVGVLALSIMGLFLLPDLLGFPALSSYTSVKSIPVLRDAVRPVKVLWDLPESSWGALPRFLAVFGAGLVIYAAAWGRRWKFGLFTAFSLPLIAWPMAVGAVSYAVYWVIEFVISVGLLISRRLGRDRGRVPASLLAKRLAKGATPPPDAGVLEPAAPVAT
jgi:hypothetical protein